jgi:hypothetical protein
MEIIKAMSKPKNLFSINALTAELQRNFRTVSKALSTVPADGTLAGRPAWHLSTAIAAMRRYEGQSNRFDGRQSVGGAGNDWRDIENYGLPPYLDAAATRGLAMLDRMFDAATVEERRAVYDPALLDAWEAAFEREYQQLGPEFEAAYRPVQEQGAKYYRALVAKMLAG